MTASPGALPDLKYTQSTMTDTRFPLNMKISFRIFLIALASLWGATVPLRADEPLLSIPFGSYEDLEGWEGEGVIEDGSVIFDQPESSKSRKGIGREIEPSLLQGKVVRMSCEARGENLLNDNREPPYHGAKVQLVMRRQHEEGQRQEYWVDLPFPRGSFEWKKVERLFAAPREMDSATVYIGFQESAGTFMVRNLKFETLGECVNISAVANMGLVDGVAGDGKGGWTDQGPSQDGRPFVGKLKMKSFFGIPIHVETEGTGILVMNHERLGGAPESVEIPVRPVKASHFFLMHTAAWASATEKEVGRIVIEDERGKHHEFPVNLNRDVGEWFHAVTDYPNAFPAVVVPVDGEKVAGIYISKFEIPQSLGPITKVTFQTGKSSMWLILGATLLEKDLPLPRRKPISIRAGEEWLPLAGDVQAPVAPGTALDIGQWTPERPVGSQGRVIINPEGRFAYESAPDEAIRFLACTLSPRNDEDFNTHEGIERLADGIRRSGYNMVRLHFLDRFLMEGANREGEFSPLALDRFDYLIHCMKQRGLYLNLDLMTSWIGYTTGDIYAPDHQNPLRSFKARIHFEPEVRENWRKGVEKVLCRVNPYTGTRLIDDPVLAMAVGYNEQEYGFWRPFDTTHAVVKWRRFLETRYGTIGALKKAWGAKAAAIASFGEIPCFGFSSRLPEGADAARFLMEVETETARWYQKVMREMGYPGPVTAYNCGKSMYYNMVRREMPFIAMNAYHAHPSNWIQPGSVISQKSSIEERFKIMRDFLGARLAAKPLIVTEYGLVFWNRYRYEQAFTVGAYAAMQGLDGLTVHGSPVRYRDARRIHSFDNSMDPIAKASEFLTWFLFIRGDVSEVAQRIHAEISPQEVFRKDGLMGGMPTDLSLMALIARMDVRDGAPSAISSGKDARNSLSIRLSHTSPVLVSDAGFSQTMDDPDTVADTMLKALRDSGLIDPSNQSDGKAVFQSATGEILADTSRNFMRVDTPRFQGICAEAGERAGLTDVTIEGISQRGVLAVVSIDGLKPIRDAGRLVVVYASNASNSGMQFADKGMTVLKQVGDQPSLLRRGRFSVTIRNANAGALKLYPLDFSGRRLKAIEPSRVHGTLVSFDVDTLRDGATVFFEIQADQQA